MSLQNVANAARAHLGRFTHSPGRVKENIGIKASALDGTYLAEFQLSELEAQAPKPIDTLRDDCLAFVSGLKTKASADLRKRIATR